STCASCGSSVAKCSIRSITAWSACTRGAARVIAGLPAAVPAAHRNGAGSRAPRRSGAPPRRPSRGPRTPRSRCSRRGRRRRGAGCSGRCRPPCSPGSAPAAPRGSCRARCCPPCRPRTMPAWERSALPGCGDHAGAARVCAGSSRTPDRRIRGCARPIPPWKPCGCRSTPASCAGLRAGACSWARAGWPLQGRPLPGLVFEQAWKPDADALQAQGFVPAPPEDTARYPLVLLLPPRQREQARAWFARALARLATGGRVIACMHNKAGAKTGEADLARLAGPLRSLSKHHCRVFWSAPLQAPADPALLDEWRVLDAPRRIEVPGAPGGAFLSRPGVFAWDRVDAASRLLAGHLPGDLRGDVADLGAGWGFLAREVLARNPGIAALDLYEA